MKWQCADNHTWPARFDDIRNGEKWCPKCRKVSIEECRELAIERGGKCLSKKIINTSVKLDWSCKLGHIWTATYSHIKGGSWCGKCRLMTIEQCQEMASKRGGECLSTEIVRSDVNLEWSCEKKHIWTATPSEIKRGSWCPFCRLSLAEEIVRRYMEAIFSVKFPHTNATNSPVGKELDGFNSALKIAFEHHGAQHYRICYMTPTALALQKIKQRDVEKKQACVDNGISLFVIRELLKKTKRENILKCIEEQANDLGIKIPPDVESRFASIDIDDLYIQSKSKVKSVKRRKIFQKKKS